MKHRSETPLFVGKVFFSMKQHSLPFRAKRETPWNTIETPLKHAINETHQTLVFIFSFFFFGVSKNSGTPKWMIYNGNPGFKMDDLGAGKPTIFGNIFFSVFHWSLAQLRWWPPALWYPWVRCLTGGVWDQVQKISEEKKTWLEKSRVKKREITKHICAYIVYILYVSICMMI